MKRGRILSSYVIYCEQLFNWAGSSGLSPILSHLFSLSDQRKRPCVSRCHQVKVCFTSLYLVLSGKEKEKKKEVVDSNQLIIDTHTGQSAQHEWASGQLKLAPQGGTRRIQSFVKLVDFYSSQNQHHHHYHHQNKIIISGGGKKQQK